MSCDQGRSFANVFRGRAEGDTIEGTWRSLNQTFPSGDGTRGIDGGESRRVPFLTENQHVVSS